MAQSLLWEKLQATDVAAINQIREASKVRLYLEHLFKRSPPSWLIAEDSDPAAASKNDILLEFFFHNLRFCRERRFDYEKTSTFFSIMYWTHTNSMSTRASFRESTDILHKYLVRHSVHRPPFSEAIFDEADVKNINAYAMNTYYRHYTAYLCAFTARDLLTTTTYYGADNNERPRVPKPLALGMEPKAWSHLLAERKQKAEEEAAKVEAQLQAEAAEKEREAEEAALLGDQLDNLKGMVTKLTADNLDDLEAKINAIAAKLGDAGKGSTLGGTKGSKK